MHRVHLGLVFLQHSVVPLVMYELTLHTRDQVGLNVTFYGEFEVYANQHD